MRMKNTDGCRADTPHVVYATQPVTRNGDNEMLNERQYEQLLKPLNQARVEKRSAAGRSLSYLAAWDVKAHLIRIFGFGGWSADVIDAELAFEEQVESSKGGKNWNVGYRVTLSLRIPVLKCSYTEVAVGFAKLPDRGEAHDMAVKTAESDALKRAAINLGTQFGLSLYDDGATRDVVQVTLDRVSDLKSAPSDSESEGQVAASGAGAAVIPDTDGAAQVYEDIKAAFGDENMSKVERMSALVNIKKQVVADGQNNWIYQGNTIGVWLDRAIAAIK